MSVCECVSVCLCVFMGLHCRVLFGCFGFCLFFLHGVANK